MWLTKLLDIISHVVPLNPISGIEELITRLNPDKIYVENVRSLLGVPHRLAVTVCETAVRQGFFSRGVEVLCPDGTVAASAEREEELPSSVNWWTQEDGHDTEIHLPTQ